MNDLSRPLFKNEQIESFLYAIDFNTYFSNDDNVRHCFPSNPNITGKEIDWITAYAISHIKSANEDLGKVIDENTLESKNYRSEPYVEEDKREKLREQIKDELIHLERLDNDDNISLKNGGMLPKGGEALIERKAIIVIGLPASGKSTIAAKISDYYKAVLIDSDFAKRKIPEYYKTNGATLVHKESKQITDSIIIEMIQYGVNIVLPIIGIDYEDVASMIKRLKRHHYSVKVILVELDRVKATQRALGRFLATNRYVPLTMILDVYSNNPSLTFYRLLSNKSFNNIPFALIDTDVPLGQRQKIKVNRNFIQIHKII